MAKTKKPRLALVFGSGAARGWAHIGVLHELDTSEEVVELEKF